MIKLCVFDCDGTLIDSQHSIIASMAAAFAAHGLAEPSASSVRQVVGLALTAAVARLLPDADVSTHELVSRSYRDAFSDMRRRGELTEPLFPGAVDALEAIEAAGWLLGVATGKSHRGLLATLAGHGLEQRFVTLQTADHAPSKPSPEMLRQAMTEAGAEPQSTVMIGDTSFDIEMARNAGALAVGVKWGYHDEEDLWSSGAHSVIGEFDELLPEVERLMVAG
jgi:phosphoglycolate phosphatase